MPIKVLLRRRELHWSDGDKFQGTLQQPQSLIHTSWKEKINRTKQTHLQYREVLHSLELNNHLVKGNVKDRWPIKHSTNTSFFCLISADVVGLCGKKNWASFSKWTSSLLWGFLKSFRIPVSSESVKSSPLKMYILIPHNIVQAARI